MLPQKVNVSALSGDIEAFETSPIKCTMESLDRRTTQCLQIGYKTSFSRDNLIFDLMTFPFIQGVQSGSKLIYWHALGTILPYDLKPMNTRSQKHATKMQRMQKNPTPSGDLIHQYCKCRQTSLALQFFLFLCQTYNCTCIRVLTYLA